MLNTEPITKEEVQKWFETQQVNLKETCQDLQADSAAILLVWPTHLQGLPSVIWTDSAGPILPVQGEQLRNMIGQVTKFLGYLMAMQEQNSMLAQHELYRLETGLREAKKECYVAEEEERAVKKEVGGGAEED
jgi:hypothetical protein